MEFITNLDKDEFESFALNHKYSHFLESYLWGEHQKKVLNKDYDLIGVKVNDKLVAASLILKTNLYFGYKYYYAPRGFLIDYSNKELLEFFTNSIKQLMKKDKAIFITIDPDVIYKRNYIIDDPRDVIFNNLKALNYKHTGFNHYFENMQPRFTFQIDITKDFEKDFSRNVKRAIKKGEQLSTTQIGTLEDLDTFYKIMQMTEEKKDFIAKSFNYYQELFKLFNDKYKLKLYMGCINTIKIKEDLNKQISLIEDELKSNLKETTRLEKEKQLKRLNKELNEYQNVDDDNLCVNAYLIMYYHDKGWFLYGGNHNKFISSNSTYKTYLDILNDAKEHNIKIMDQFGTVSEIDENYHLMGIHNFKKGFGGDYIEFIGEFNLIQNKLLYKIFKTLIPIKRKIVRLLKKK